MTTASQLLAVGLDAVKDTLIALDELIELEDAEEVARTSSIANSLMRWRRSCDV